MLSAPVDITASNGIDPASLRGLSDLVRDDSGDFWAVPERSPPGAPDLTRAILRLDFADAAHPKAIARFTYSLPASAALDTESIASLAPGLFAVGTELTSGQDADDERTDAVFEVRVDAKGASLVPGGGWLFGYEPWGMRRTTNNGIEGMCATAGWLAMVAEHRASTTTPSFAPMILRRRSPTGLAPQEIHLQLRVMHEGGISALTCCESGGELDVLAILRGLGPDGTSTHRLLGFRPLSAEHSDITPDLDVDLEPLYPRTSGPMPNVEGLAPLDADSIAMITDDSDIGAGARLLVLRAAR